jgi:probable phosphoglycerate mutase
VDRVILARHGESERSLAGLTNGDPAVRVGLTETGRQEARRLGEQLQGDPIGLCVTSEFARAQETADLALEGRDVPRLVLPDLNDIRFGEFEGRPLTDYRAWAHAHGPEDVCPGGGESRAQTVARYVRGYRTILARPEAWVLVVAHGLPVRYVLDALEERTPAAAVGQIPYAEPFRLTAAELTRAVDLLEAWVLAPAWTT